MNGEAKGDKSTFQPSDSQVAKVRALREKILERIANDAAFKQGLLDNPTKVIRESGFFEEIQAHRNATLDELTAQGFDAAFWLLCSARTCASGSACSDSV